ncbi:MAG TPA: O-antigen ligase family protein [Acidobacteriota bacterium]|nr:O-antigen ligase family protein [Acidobacteriota bacterium]
MRDKWIRVFLGLGIVASLASIFVANILLFVALLLWIAYSLSHRNFRLILPGFAWPFFAYALLTIVSMAFSAHPLISAINLKKLLLFSCVFLFVTMLKRRDVKMIFRGVYALLAVSASLAILQYFWLLEVGPLNRVRGLMSHWMTFSAQLMMGIVSILALLGLYIARHPKRNRLRDVLCLLTLVLMSLALILTQTRNAWLGTAFGVLLVAAVYGYRFGLPSRRTALLRGLYGLRWTLAVVLVMGLTVMLMPARYQERLRAGFDPGDYTTSIRIELLKTGCNMVSEHPLTGVGPRMIPDVYPRYATRDFPPEAYQHLHNCYVQIAAESGLLALLAWLTMWGVLAVSLLHMARRAGDDRFLFFASVSALTSLAAFLAAGLFEYNFGDSEVVILLLFLIASPYAVQQDPDSPQAPAQA